MKEFLKKEPVRRGLRTFVEAAAGYVIVNAAALDLSVDNALKGLMISAIAAGIAAVMNMEGKQ